MQENRKVETGRNSRATGVAYTDTHDEEELPSCVLLASRMLLICLGTCNMLQAISELVVDSRLEARWKPKIICMRQIESL